MKRLKSKLLAMDPNTTTYQDIYEGGMTVHYSNGYPTAETVYENTYYASPETIPFPIGFRVERTHKLALDKPTVTIIGTRIRLHFTGGKYCGSGGIWHPSSAD